MCNNRIDRQIANILKTFEYTSQKVWPNVRFLFSRSLAPRCRQCTISSKVAYVELNDGICSWCEEYNRRMADPEYERYQERYRDHQVRKLDEILEAHQGKGAGRYDVLVLFSGGKDSVYMLLRIKKKFPKLRMLLLTINNGCYSRLSLIRSKEIAAKLDLDLFTYQPSSTLYKTLYRYTLMHAGDRGTYETVDRLDGQLNQFLGIHFGYEWNIPIVFSGIDFAQNLVMRSQTYFETPFADMCSRIMLDRMERRSGFKIEEIFSEDDQKMFWDGTGKDRDRIPRFILPFAAWRTDKSAVRRELDEEGLLPEKESSPLLTNNQVLGIMTAVDVNTIGYSSFEIEFAKMIRHGENDPVYWGNLFQFSEWNLKKRFIIRRTVAKVLPKLDLSLENIGLG